MKRILTFQKIRFQFFYDFSFKKPEHVIYNNAFCTTSYPSVVYILSTAFSQPLKRTLNYDQ